MMAETATIPTLSALEHRLRRLEYYLSGSTTNDSSILQPITSKGRDKTVSARLTRLEHGLATLSNRSRTVRDLLQLRTSPSHFAFSLPLFLRLSPPFGTFTKAPSAPESTYPTLFHPNATSPSTFTYPEKLATITASAPSFPETASRLSTLRDLSIPPASASAQLIALQPRIAELERRQEEQKRETGKLRGRSARVLQR